MNGTGAFSCRAAACVDGSAHEKEWRIFFINDDSFVYERIELTGFGHSFGGMGSVEEINSCFFSLPPGKWVQLWRENDFEMRMSFTVAIAADGRIGTLLADFPKLYRRKQSLDVVDGIGLPGFVVTMDNIGFAKPRRD